MYGGGILPQAYVYFNDDTYRKLANRAYTEHTSVGRVASRILDEQLGGAVTHGRKKGK
ncbi:hypothetical protein LCGC14_2447340 [marine sediment metagenome]|uniref:Uncharacterized protein n=1 Tax=marine sediment metagenome TaxID=412755 RepID=A0A0F9DUB0_9ZZZZ